MRLAKLGRKRWPHSKETKIKMSLASKGKRKSEAHRYSLGLAKRLNPVRYWLGKKRVGFSGASNPMWKGGSSRCYKTGYYSTDYKRWRISVFERDGYRCQGCGNIGGYLTAHHVKSFAHYPDSRFDIDNGVTLCELCHSLTDNYKGRAKKRKT